MGAAPDPAPKAVRALHGPAAMRPLVISASLSHRPCWLDGVRPIAVRIWPVHDGESDFQEVADFKQGVFLRKLPLQPSLMNRR